MADLIFLAVIALFAFYGARKGFIRALFGMVSVILSVVLGSLLYRPIAMLIMQSGAWDSIRAAAAQFISDGTHSDIAAAAMSDIAARTAVNAVSFAGAALVVRIIITALSAVTHFASRLPVIKQADKLLGFITGAVSGAAVCWIAMLVVSHAAPAGMLSGFADAINSSPISSMIFISMATPVK